jgi:hypothetical protein
MFGIKKFFRRIQSLEYQIKVLEDNNRLLEATLYKQGIGTGDSWTDQFLLLKPDEMNIRKQIEELRLSRQNEQMRLEARLEAQIKNTSHDLNVDIRLLAGSLGKRFINTETRQLIPIEKEAKK